MAADPAHSSTFERLDCNCDQQISKSEAQSDKTLSGASASADTNDHGYLSKSEYQAKSSSKGCTASAVVILLRHERGSITRLA
jgi:hypothetical protein